MTKYNEFYTTDEEFLQNTFTLEVEYFIDETYRTYLKREPDEAGKNSYVQLIRTNEIDRAQLLMSIRQSSEFKSLWSTPEENNSEEQNKINEQGANVDSENIPENSQELQSENQPNEIRNWRDYVSVLAGMNPKKIVDENFINMTSTLNDMDFLRAVYYIYLQRDADLSGLGYWSTYLKDDQFRRSIFLSDMRRSEEFKLKWSSSLDKIKSCVFSKLKKLIKGKF
jgi:hypothetical protein